MSLKMIKEKSIMKMLKFVENVRWLFSTVKKWGIIMSNEQRNQIIIYDFQCQCKYCEFCAKNAIIYDECDGCYEGKHPDLRNIINHLELQTTLRRERS